MASFITGYHFKEQLRCKQPVTCFCCDEAHYLAYDQRYLYKVKYSQSLVTRKVNMLEISPNYQIVRVLDATRLLYFALSEDNFVFLLAKEDLEYLRKMTFQTYVRPQIHFLEQSCAFLVLGQQSQCVILSTIQSRQAHLQISVQDVQELPETVSAMTGYAVKDNSLLLWNDTKVNVYNTKHFDKDYSYQCSGITAVEITFVYHLLILGLRHGSIKVSLLPQKKHVEDNDPANMFAIKPHSQAIQHLAIINDQLHSIAENIGIFDLKSFTRLYTFEYPRNLEWLRFLDNSNAILGIAKGDVYLARYFDALTHEFQIPQQGRMILNKSLEKQVKYQFLTAMDEHTHLERKAELKDSAHTYHDIQYKKITHFTFLSLSLHVVDDATYVFTLYNTGRLVMDKIAIDKKKDLLAIHSSHQRPYRYYFLYRDAALHIFSRDKRETTHHLHFHNSTGLDTLVASALHFHEPELHIHLLTFQTVPRKDSLLAAAGSEGQLLVYPLKKLNDPVIRAACDAQLDLGHAVQLCFVQNRTKIGLVAASNHNRFYLFALDDRLRLLQVYQLHSQLLMKSDAKYLFLALLQPPHTLGVFAFKSASTLILKSVSDYDDHQSAIVSLDVDSQRKWVLTASTDCTIKIFTYQKFLIARIAYHEPISQVWFVNEDFMILSGRGTISLIKKEKLQMEIEFQSDVSKQCKRENNAQILSINEFFSQQVSESKEEQADLSGVFKSRKMKSPEKVVGIGEYRHNYQLRVEKRQRRKKLPMSVNEKCAVVERPRAERKSQQLVRQEELSGQNSQSSMEKSIFISQYLQKKYKKIYNLQYLVSQERRLYRGKKEGRKREASQQPLLPLISEHKRLNQSVI